MSSVPYTTTVLRYTLTTVLRYTLHQSTFPFLFPYPRYSIDSHSIGPTALYSSLCTHPAHKRSVYQLCIQSDNKGLEQPSTLSLCHWIIFLYYILSNIRYRISSMYTPLYSSMITVYTVILQYPHCIHHYITVSSLYTPLHYSILIIYTIVLQYPHCIHHYITVSSLYTLLYFSILTVYTVILQYPSLYTLCYYSILHCIHCAITVS